MYIYAYIHGLDSEAKRRAAFAASQGHKMMHIRRTEDCTEHRLKTTHDTDNKLHITRTKSCAEHKLNTSRNTDEALHGAQAKNCTEHEIQIAQSTD